MGDPEECLLELLVPGRHPAELLQLAEQPLDPVPLPIGGTVQRLRVDPVGLRRDHRLGTDGPRTPSNQHNRKSSRSQ